MSPNFTVMSPTNGKKKILLFLEKSKPHPGALSITQDFQIKKKSNKGSFLAKSNIVLK